MSTKLVLYTLPQEIKKKLASKFTYMAMYTMEAPGECNEDPLFS